MSNTGDGNTKITSRWEGEYGICKSCNKEALIYGLHCCNWCGHTQFCKDCDCQAYFRAVLCKPCREKDKLLSKQGHFLPQPLF